MLNLYCLPGRLIAHLQYLFPKKYMDAVRSKRQRDSVLIHALYSTLVYATLGLGALSLISP